MRAHQPAKPLPIYQQIAELIARQIKAGYWHQGERLPTEAQLAQTLDIAVGTLRKALALLEKNEVLTRIQGSGTYVNKTSATQQIYELFRLELTTGPGLPTAQVLSAQLLPMPAHLPRFGEPTAALASDPTPTPQLAWRVRRIRYLSQIPVALEEIWFQSESLVSLQTSELGDSMYLFYQQRLGVWIARVEDRLWVAAAPDWACQPSSLAPGGVAGFIERLSWTATNCLAEYSQTWFDPAVCRYASRLNQ